MYVIKLFLGIFFTISFIAKNILHVYIAYKNSNPIVASGQASALELSWFYLKPVAKEYERAKKICNYLQAYNLMFLLAVIIVALVNSVFI